MGSKSTKLFKNSSEPSSKASEDKTDFRGHNNHDSLQRIQSESSTDKTFTSPFVYYRRGSMYIDEDGDSAHEFYVEVTDGSKATLKKINNKTLTPQGDVLLEVPCLRNDYPVILLDQNNKIKD